MWSVIIIVIAVVGDEKVMIVRSDESSNSSD